MNAADEPEATFRYEAFLSYSHRDRRWADWLHRAIETYRVPRRLVVKGAPPRLAPIFRDREELPTAHDLGRKIEEALVASRRLIVICSPHATQSRWVNAEIARFKALGRGEQIFCLIVDGEPHTHERGLPAERECFPPALLEGDASVEPLAADARDGSEGKNAAKLKILAGMLGIGLDELRRRELQRRNRRLAWFSAVSVAGVVLTSTLAAFAWLARNEADASRQRAEREAETARRTTQFMVGLFDVVDPNEARGRSVTANEILERGVADIHRELGDEPQVQATLLQTMGKVFTGLGLYDRAVELLEESERAQGSAASADTAATQIALANALYLRGDYDAAEQRYRGVLSALDRQPWSAERSDAANGLADVLTDTARYAAAIALYREAYARDTATWGATDVHAARTANGLGAALADSGDAKGAEASYRLALAAYRSVYGPEHPKVAEAISNLGSALYYGGDLAGAAACWREALPLYRKMYGDAHPEVASLLNNIGRAELEGRRFAAAIPLLEESIAIDRKLDRGDHNDVVFALNSLALAYRGRGDIARARQLLDEAAALAAKTEHRMWGPILMNQADLECSAGRPRDALTQLDEAAARVEKAYPNEPWRLALVDSVRGECLSVAGRTADGEALLLRSLPIIEARWGKSSLFTIDARTRIAAHYARIGNADAAQRYRAS